MSQVFQLRMHFINLGLVFLFTLSRNSSETSNGIAQQETGEIVDRGSEHEGISVRGSFSYTDPATNQVYTVTYVSRPTIAFNQMCCYALASLIAFLFRSFALFRILIVFFSASYKTGR